MSVLEELQAQLAPFCREQTGDATAAVSNVEQMPGHAGFSYGFTAHFREADRERVESFVLRLPPPGVKLEGTADVLRQVRVLSAVRGNGVPVAPVVWSGADPRWFGRPYFVVPKLEGAVLGDVLDSWTGEPDADALRRMTRQAVEALAALHAIDWIDFIPEWGPPLQPASDIERWDRFWERAADPELVKLGPEVKRRLLERAPTDSQVGIFHGDFQSSNLLYRGERLQAVIDWELAGVGPVLNDLGWFMVFNDRESWAHEPRSRAPMPMPDEIGEMYAEASGRDLGDVAWYRALAAYKFAIIGGFNLMLHRRGKRDDPHWERLLPSIPRLLERSIEVLDGAP
ncbi:MAG: phosphotransferase family protein [Dehalococcoidia bacterium]